MPIKDSRHIRHRAATLVGALALAACLPLPVLAQTASEHASSALPPAPVFTPCPLGSFNCPKPPVNYAMCRANALLAFYQPGLPTDSRGRESSATNIFAEHVDSSDPKTYQLDGHVSLARYDQLLQAEHMTYNDRTTAYLARGHVTYQDSGQLLSASQVQGTTQPDYAVADDVNYQLLISHGNGTATRAELVDSAHSIFTQATYSTCDPGHHIWEFRAGQITTNKQTGVGVARDATLRLGNVPILYLPWISFPIDDRRKTGFLYPTFSNNSNSGVSVSIPYYLNLAPNYDATLTPHLYSKRGLMLGSQFRYLLGSSKGQLDITYLPSDRLAGSDHDNRPRSIEDGADRYLVQFQHVTGLGHGWRLHAAINRASDKYYFQDFESELKGYVTPSVLASNAGLSGSGRWWDASVVFTEFQNVDPIYTDSRLQYKRWPAATFSFDLPLSRTLDLGMHSEAVAFRKDAAVEGNRLDLYPYLEADWQGAAWFVRPRVAWRYTSYELINHPDLYGYTQTRPSRSLPISSLDSGLIFERDTSLFGEHYTQTLEPRLYYLYVPYRDQRDLPVFDSKLMTFGYWQLFTPNRFSGADRQMDANNLTAAVTTRLLDDSGVEAASFSFGQIRYFDPQQVQLGPTAPATHFHGSDYVAQLGLQLSDSWRLNSVYQWSPNQNRPEAGMLQLQRRLGFAGVLNFSYRYRYHFMDQLDASAVIPVAANWRLLARWNVALSRSKTQWQRGDPKTLAALFGVEYEGCCVAVRLVGRHYVRNVFGDTDNAIMFELVFKGLGSSSPRTETFLHHAILGYQ